MVACSLNLTVDLSCWDVFFFIRGGQPPLALMGKFVNGRKSASTKKLPELVICLDI